MTDHADEDISAEELAALIAEARRLDAQAQMEAAGREAKQIVESVRTEPPAER